MKDSDGTIHIRARVETSWFSANFSLAFRADQPRSPVLRRPSKADGFTNILSPSRRAGFGGTPDDAVAAYETLGGKIAVVKAQIHAGRPRQRAASSTTRRKRRRVGNRLTKFAQAAEGLLGKTLVTIQTGPEGKRSTKSSSKRAATSLANCTWASCSTARMMPVLMVSTEGGVEIEKVAEETPELIHKEHFDPAVGLEAFQVRKLCKKLGIEGAAAKAATSFMNRDVPLLRRLRLLAGRDQSAGDHRRRRNDRAGRQDHLR
jgi:succinyl-CoA synthetase beta subunit